MVQTTYIRKTKMCTTYGHVSDWPIIIDLPSLLLPLWYPLTLLAYVDGKNRVANHNCAAAFAAAYDTL